MKYNLSKKDWFRIGQKAGWMEKQAAYSPSHTSDLIGAFTETSRGKRFEYRKSKDQWGISHGLPHEVYVSDKKLPSGMSNLRAANVKNTVCYIATDEDEEGKPVLSKWKIKNHVKYISNRE